MNAERLLALYERVAEAPDAITRLRRFILDLAVRGKLVPQDAQDGLVEKRYQKEPSGKGIPATWRLLNFGKFCDIEGGSQPPKSQFIEEPREGYVRLFQIRDLGERPVPTYIPRALARSFCKEGEILIGRYGASIGKIFWAQEGAYNVAMAKFIWPTDTFILAFAFLLLKSDFLQGPLLSATRSAQAGFNKSDLAPINFPLPPLAEQHRIVAKVDELMALCDSLEAARKDREAKRDRLSAASLARLNTPDPETFTADARFTLEALPALTTRPNQIKQLRQTILNLAVRGKLVPQDANDEPITVKLQRALARRRALVKAKMVRSKKLDSLDDLQVTADLPSSWVLERLGNLVDPENTISYGVLVPGEDVSDGIPFVRAQDLALFGHPHRPTKTIAPEIERAYARTRLRGGEILVCVVGSIGKLGVVPQSWARANIARAVARILPIQEISREYLLVVLQGQPVQSYFTETTRTLAQPTLNVGLIEQTPIPLPPLAEQYRIVAKVDELMALCDRLEASLTTSDQTRTRLLEATLTEALAPAGDFSNEGIQATEKVFHA